jgi:exo-beta-1,3-glucanase (GH17 family)
VAVQAHPVLCEESDYCAINAHAFFDSTIAAPQAGDWLANTVEDVKSALSYPMRVVVAETGWPIDGVANGKAVPGMANQKMALDSIRETFASNPDDVYLFSAYNDLWKAKTMATFNADQFWGINGAVAKCDL